MNTQTRNYRLALLQLEQYDTERYLAKVKVQPETQELAKRLRWTARLKLTNFLGLVVGIPLANSLIGWPTKIIEKVVGYWVKNRLATLRRDGMKVVAIAGSYGKTSVKHYAYEILRRQYRVVATPESYNTVLGIAKTLYWEVDRRTEVFLVEVGAYHVGDITYLLQMVNPDIGVMTGIARQHLERFGSWENIISAKSEIAEYMKLVDGVLVANKADATVAKVIAKINGKVTWYGAGSNRNQINLEGGKVIAKSLGMKANAVEEASQKVREVAHRFEMTTERYGMRVIDDAFSSNDVGFASAVAYLGQQKQYTRILVTPGLVELGAERNKIHEELGKTIVGKVDYVYLVGENERTKYLEKGIGGKVPVIKLTKTLDFVQAVKKLKLQKEPLVLIENDVTENYD